LGFSLRYSKERGEKRKFLMQKTQLIQELVSFSRKDSSCVNSAAGGGGMSTAKLESS